MKTYARTVLLFALAYLLAPTTASAETLYACKLTNLGTVRMVSATTNCTQYETKISWNSTGPQGLTGSQGPDGPMGPPGVQGTAGVQGAQGLMGPPGSAGAQGPKGDPGPVGPKGADGATGPAGQVGATGLQGPVGVAGPPGPAGSQASVGSIKGQLINACTPGTDFTDSLVVIPGRSFSVLTGPDGAFQMDNVPAATYNIAVKISGTLAASIPDVVVDPSQNGGAVDVHQVDLSDLTTTANCGACGNACLPYAACIRQGTSLARVCDCPGGHYCGSACGVTHFDGLGDPFFDCSALNTHTVASATEACETHNLAHSR